MENDKLAKERNEALVFLQKHPLGTLTTINVDGVPEATAIYFSTEISFTINFVTKAMTRKFKNLSRNPTATLLTFNENELTSVEVTGSAYVVEDTIEFVQIIEKFQSVITLQNVGYWFPPISQIEAGKFVACKLIPHMLHFRKFTHSVNDPAFPQQISFNPRRFS